MLDEGMFGEKKGVKPQPVRYFRLGETAAVDSVIIMSLATLYVYEWCELHRRPHIRLSIVDDRPFQYCRLSIQIDIAVSHGNVEMTPGMAPCRVVWASRNEKIADETSTVNAGGFPLRIERLSLIHI